MKTTEDLLRKAAESEEATHRLALYLGTSDDRVREHREAAMLKALARLPSRQPLRRGKDRAVIDAVRTLVRDLPATAPGRHEILMRLTSVSRQASAGHWPPDTWTR